MRGRKGIILLSVNHLCCNKVRFAERSIIYFERTAGIPHELIFALNFTLKTICILNSNSRNFEIVPNRLHF
jgi:hypothetical protein